MCPAPVGAFLFGTGDALGICEPQLIANEQRGHSGRNFQLSEKLYRLVIKKWLLKKKIRKGKISSAVGMSSRICRNRFVRAG